LNANELCLKNYGMAEDKVKKELERYTNMFPQFFVHVAMQEFLEIDFEKVLHDINQEQYKKLNLSDLKFIKRIVTDYSIISFFYTQTEEEKKEFYGKVQEFIDISPFFSYQEQPQLLHYNKNEDIEDKLHENLEREYYYDKTNLKARDDYSTYLKDFIHSETNTVALICSDKTKEEKIDGIESYIKKMQNVDDGYYMINGSKISLKECEDIVKSIYSDYFDMNGYWKNPVDLNQLLILYNYYRLTRKKEAGNLFFKKILVHIREGLPNSRANFQNSEVDEYYQSEQIKKYNPIEQAIAISYNNVFSNYKVICNSIESYLQSDVSIQVKIAREEFQQQELWQEQEVNTEDLQLLLKQQKLCNGDKQIIDELKEKINKTELQISYAFNIKNTYLQMQRIMDVLYVMIKGVELYKEFGECSGVFSVNKVHWKLKRMDDKLKEILFKDPFLYEEHIDKIKEVKTQILERREYLVMEEKLSEEILDKDIELEEAEKEKFELEQDKELLKLVIERKEAEVDCMRSILNDTVEALKEESVNEIMLKRLTIISDEKLQESDMELVDELSNTINSILQKKAKDTEYEGLQEACKKVKEELGVTKADRLPDEILQVLSTAEFLYGRFIEEKESIEGFDYSCISAMYYQALEKTYNYFMYSGYIANINRFKGDLKKLLESKENKINISYGYFPENRLSNYVIDYVDGKKYDYIAKDTCEYGNFIKLLKTLRGENKNRNINENICKQVTKYRNYICKVFGWTIDSKSKNGLPKPLDGRIKRLIKDLDFARNHRNDACHGGIIIDYDRAKEDKTFVLVKEVEETSNIYKKIIIQILELYRE